jgi:drug/metabolite transporter (DMT)-like permease
MASPLHLFIVILSLGFCWGVAFPVVSIANQGAEVFTIVAVRLCLAAIMMMTYRAIVQGRWGYTLAEAKSSINLSIVGNVVPFCLITWGQNFVASGATSLIISVVPIIVLFLAHYTLHDEKITVKKLLGTLLGFGGVMLIIIPDVQAATNGKIWAYTAISGSALCYAITHVYSRAIGQKHDNITLATGCMVFGALIMVPIALSIDGVAAIPAITRQSWLAIGFLGLFSSAIATILFFYTLRLGGTMLTSYAGYLVPIYGVMFGAILLGEAITWRLILALILVLTGILFVQKAIRERFMMTLKTILARHAHRKTPKVDL